jgi:hypothetical protein
VKLVALVALPPFVITTILPVAAPVGTSAVTSVSFITVKVADFPSNVTLVVWSRPVPVMVTEVPTGPLDGVKLVMVGSTLKVCVLVRVVVPVVTVTDPVSAAAGTVAVINVVPVSTMVVAFAPPNLTTEELLKPWPRMPTLAPSAGGGLQTGKRLRADVQAVEHTVVAEAAVKVPPVTAVCGGASTVPQSCDSPAAYFKCLLTALVI